MHYCAQCGQVLNVTGGHRVGVDTCPKCGSRDVSATPAPTTTQLGIEIPEVELQTLLNWAMVWLDVAQENADAAVNARNAGALPEEFRGGLVAIGAASFAIEAEKMRVHGDQKLATTDDPPRRSWPLNSGDWMGQFLQERSVIDSATAESLGKLFALRNGAVHPTAKLERFVPHPAGTHTDPRLVLYNADEARALRHR